MSPVTVQKFNSEQINFLHDLHAQLMASQTLERPSEAYALKGLLCELTKPEYMDYRYILEKLNLFFDVTFQIKPEKESE